MQAAIGRTQLGKLSAWVAIRQRNAAILKEHLADISVVRMPSPPSHIEHAFYRFYFFVDPSGLKSAWSRDRIVDEISEAGIPCFSGSCSEIYLEKAFSDLRDWSMQRLPVARELGETSVALLVHPTLEVEHMARAGHVVREILRQASR